MRKKAIEMSDCNERVCECVLRAYVRYVRVYEVRDL
jgi:hypothetical protein